MRPGLFRRVFFPHDDAIDRGVFGRELVPVVCQEKFGRQQCHSLVAVDEGGIARDSERIGGSECGRIRRRMGGLVLRTRESRAQESGIPQAGSAAMFGDLLLVEARMAASLTQRQLTQRACAARYGASWRSFAGFRSAARNRDRTA
jgi:hypothetical protein